MSRGLSQDPAIAVALALAVSRLCEDCIVASTGVAAPVVATELAALNGARRRQSRRPIGPFFAYCHRCEMRKLAFRLGG